MRGDFVTSRRRLGAFGEEVACRFLVNRGAVILGRNLTEGRGEVDILARVDQTVVAVEVKTVAAGQDQATDPLRSFSTDKALQVAAVGSRLVPPARRVDVVGVVVRPGGVDVRWVKGVG
jgi:putative endonuclease